jgi:hypothetical protein
MEKDMSLTPFGRKIVSTLIQLQGCAIGSLDAVTSVTLTGGKKNPMQGRVTKKAEGGNVMFFCNSNNNAYNDMVKRRLAAEGRNPEGFVLGKRVWGERLPDTPFIEHKGELYLDTIFLKAPKKVTYYLDGQEIDKSAVQGLPVSSEGEQGGLENKVIIRTYKLSSVTQIKMGELSVLPE